MQFCRRPLRGAARAQHDVSKRRARRCNIGFVVCPLQSWQGVKAGQAERSPPQGNVPLEAAAAAAAPPGAACGCDLLVAPQQSPAPGRVAGGSPLRALPPAGAAPEQPPPGLLQQLLPAGLLLLPVMPRRCRLQAALWRTGAPASRAGATRTASCAQYPDMGGRDECSNERGAGVHEALRGGELWARVGGQPWMATGRCPLC